VDLAAPYALHPQVSLRAEDFGALVYHFGNRKLSFVKHPDLLAVLERLGDEPSVESALRSVGVDARRWPSFARALATLEASDMIRPRATAA
jgi:putative mycofactocin binding protein MftB